MRRRRCRASVRPTRAPSKRATKSPAVKRKLPVWRHREEWPAGQEASGKRHAAARGLSPWRRATPGIAILVFALTLRDSADPHAEGMRVVCRVLDGVLTLGIERRDAAGEETEEVLAEVPTEALAVGLQRGRTNVLMIATVHKNELFDEIFCFCDNSIRRI